MINGNAVLAISLLLCAKSLGDCLVDDTSEVALSFLEFLLLEPLEPTPPIILFSFDAEEVTVSMVS
jgi:hypothetical protein